MNDFWDWGWTPICMCLAFPHLVVDVEKLFALPVVPRISDRSRREVIGIVAPGLDGPDADVAAYPLSFLVQFANRVLGVVYRHEKKHGKCADTSIMVMVV